MDAHIYAAAFETVYLTGIQSAFPPDTLYLALVQPSYAFDRRHRTAQDIQSHELTVDSYVRQQLENVRLSRVPESSRLYVDADDVAFGALGPGERVAGAVLVQGWGDTALLRAFFPLTRQGTTGAPVTVLWPEGHLLRFSDPREG